MKRGVIIAAVALVLVVVIALGVVFGRNQLPETFQQTFIKRCKRSSR